MATSSVSIFSSSSAISASRALARWAKKTVTPWWPPSPDRLIEWDGTRRTRPPERDAETLQLGMELVRGAVSQVSHLGDGLHPGLSGGALGHDQDPDGLDGTVLRLAGAGGSATDGGPCGFDGIERVGLAVVSDGTACSAGSPRRSRSPRRRRDRAKPGAIGARPFDADFGHLAEALEPGQQGLVAGGIGREGLRADQATEWVECRSNVGVEMGVDTTRDPGWSFYDGHRCPYFP